MITLKQLTSFEIACKVEGLNPKKVIPSFALFPKADRKAMIALVKLVIIISAANRITNNGKKWIADYTNSEQVKYEPRFWRGSSGFRFLGSANWRTGTGVGSRLCFIDYGTMHHVVTMPKFLKLYNDYL